LYAASFGLAAAGWTSKIPAMMMLSGFAASMAAWTKNEGLLFALIVLAVCVVKRERVRPWIAGALPGFLILGWFKLTLAPPSDLQQPVTAIVAKILDPLRHLAVIHALPAAAGLVVGGARCRPCLPGHRNVAEYVDTSGHRYRRLDARELLRGVRDDSAPAELACGNVICPPARTTVAHRGARGWDRNREPNLNTNREARTGKREQPECYTRASNS